MSAPMTAAELARRLGGTVEGDGSALVSGIAGIRDAGPGDVTFLANPKYAADAASTRATAILVAPSFSAPTPAALIRVANPDASFAQAAMLFLPPPVKPEPGVHPTAVIGPRVTLGENVSVGPYCVIEAGAEIGDRTVLSAFVYVGRDVRLGPDGLFYPHVSIRERCRVGARAILHNGVVVGSDGFGYSVDEKGVRTKIPQIGIVDIGDDVEIGANTTVDRARFGRTRIGNGVKIDNLVQIAHNVVVGDHAVLVAQVGISGSTTIGAHAVLAGQVGVAGHLVIGDGAVIGAQSGVSKNVAPGACMFGTPAESKMDAARHLAMIGRLPALKEKVAGLESRIADLERKLAGSKDRT